jgi:hypothetical protein
VPGSPPERAESASFPKEELPRERLCRVLLLRNTPANCSASSTDSEWLVAVKSFSVVLFSRALQRSLTSCPSQTCLDNLIRLLNSRGITSTLGLCVG